MLTYSKGLNWALNILLIILQLNEQISFDDWLITRKFFLVFAFEKQFSTDWASVLHINPVF